MAKLMSELVRSPPLESAGRIVLVAGVRVAARHGDQDPRPRLLGAYACAVGTIFEERYERLDDGSLRDHARLNKSWERAWNEGDGASTVLPYDGGIHRIGNSGEKLAISVHLYGPRMSSIDGRDYDPSRDYVCDRPHDD